MSISAYHHALALALEGRITALIAYRGWFREQSPTLQAVFGDLNREYRDELRSLLRIRRQARLAWRQAEVDHGVDRYIEAQRQAHTA